MLFGKKKKSESRQFQNRQQDKPRKRPAILGDESNDNHQVTKQGNKNHSHSKEKVSLFEHKHSQQNNDDKNHLDKLVANFRAKHFNHNVLDLLGYKGFTHDRYHFLKLSGSVIDGSNNSVHRAKYAEILQIGGMGIEDLPQQATERLISDYINFWRRYVSDATCICLPLPNDSKSQQRDWQNQIDFANDQLRQNDYSPRVRKQILNRKNMMVENLGTLQSVDQYLINQGFVLLLFGRTESQLATNITNAINSSRMSLDLTRLTISAKEDILKRINNPDMML